MKKMFKKLAALAMAAVMMVGMGAAALAVDEETYVDEGTYGVTATLYKESTCENTSMGNSGIESIAAKFDGQGNVTITLVSKQVFYNDEQGQLTSFALYDAAGNKYTATENPSKTFTITGFPADQFQVGSVLRGEFKSYVSIMGTREGYLRVEGLTEK